MLDTRDIQAHYKRMRSDLLTTLDGLSEAQMTERTIHGWSAKDHLTHLALWEELRASEINRISAGFASGCAYTEEQVESLNQINHDLFRDCSVEQARWELERAHRLVLDALEAATPRGLEPEHYTDVGLISDHVEEHIAQLKAWREGRGY